ncbi:MAG TPA: hypothetical protein VHZ33_22925 [Trebonia sp.]|nr:hypothetical protein [Trebonia sp.]
MRCANAAHSGGVPSTCGRALSAPHARWVQPDNRPPRTAKLISRPSAHPQTSASPAVALVTFCSAVTQASPASSACSRVANSNASAAAASSLRARSRSLTAATAAGSRSRTAVTVRSSSARSTPDTPRARAISCRVPDGWRPA